MAGPREKKPPEDRTAFNLGLTGETQKVVRDNFLSGRLSNPEMTMQDSIRELILRGAGLECDEAALAMTRAAQRAIVQEFMVKRTREFLISLAGELDTYLKSYAPDEGDNL